MELRDYQQELASAALASTDNILIQADTGSGKTRTLAAIVDESEHCIMIAHRNLLVKQLSRELARFTIPHNIIGSTHTRRQCILEHRKLGTEQLDDSSQHYVASLDSLLSRHRRGVLSIDTDKPWRLLIDEGHHVTENNKWGKLQQIFPNAQIIAVTATVYRSDGAPLARSQGGLFDRLVQAEALKKDSVRTLIRQGHLADFECYSVPERIDGAIQLGQHDYTYKSLCTETEKVKYEMAGDAVTHYRRLADDKQAVAFCVSIEIAMLTAGEFRTAGLSAACIHSQMSQVEVSRIFGLFEARLINILCHVDMIGEGVDVPDIECLIMLRKTASIGAYRQWIGRALRTADGKERAIIIDHVGNVRRFGFPDRHLEWSLEAPPELPAANLQACGCCGHTFPAWETECPKCGWQNIQPEGCKDKEVEYIDWDLVMLERQRIEQEHRENHVLQIRQAYIGAGVMEKKIHELKLWFVDQLTDDTSIRELNQFFRDPAVRNKQYWVSQFTLADIGKPNRNKCLKVLKQWRKSA